MTESIIEVSGLKKSFHGHPVLRGVDLRVEPSQLTALIGPSGCGKSTLLRCLIGLDVFDEGSIRVGALCLERLSGHSRAARDQTRTAHELRCSMGIVFQAFNLFPHMTTLDNVARPPVIVQ